MQLPPDYEPTQRFKNVQGLVSNHFVFVLDALPDVTFYTQSVVVPEVSATTQPRPTPLATIQETSARLTYGTLQVTYLVDAEFKSYYSIYWWMKGYGFPHTNDEVKQFREKRAKQTANPRPSVRELEKTNAVLTILQADTESPVAEIRFTDVFPVGLGGITFTAAESDVDPYVHATATFAFTEFDVFPIR